MGYIAHQDPLPMGYPRQDYWHTCHFLLQRIFPTRNRTHVSWIGRRILYPLATREANNSRVLGKKEVKFGLWEWYWQRALKTTGWEVRTLAPKTSFIFHIRLEKAPFDQFLSDLKISPFLKIPVWKRKHSTACAVLLLVTQSCPTLWDPMDCSPPGFTVRGDSPGKNTEVGCHALLQGIFPTQGSNPGLPHCRWILYHLSHQGSSRILEWVACPFSRGSSWPKNRTGVSCVAGRFFTSWATGEAHNTASVQFGSVSQSCLTLCDPMNRSTPGLPVHHQLPKFTQTHVHQVSDAIQPSHPLWPPFPPVPNPS